MFAIIQAAGWPIWPLLFASIVAVALIIERLITLRRSKILPDGLLEKVVVELRQGGATPEMINRVALSSPLGRVFAAGLRNNPNTDVRIVGHTDNTGSDAINNPLSMDRAASTRSYLTGRGVDGRRIAIDGMGERYPIATNESADGRARNRRVEIFVGERPRG